MSTGLEPSKKTFSGGRLQRLFKKKSSSKLLGVDESSIQDNVGKSTRTETISEKYSIPEVFPNVQSQLVQPSSLRLQSLEKNFLTGAIVSSPCNESGAGERSDSSPGSTPGVEAPTYSKSFIFAPQPITASQSSKVTDSFSRSEAASPIPVSSSKLRWEQLRQHILLTPSNSSTPISGLPYITSYASQSQPDFSSRPQTPKPSRFARLAFRHVVDHARDTVDETTRKFEDDIRRACWAIRFDESTPPGRHFRQASQGTIGSNLYLPFVSAVSLGTTASTGMADMPSRTKVLPSTSHSDRPFIRHVHLFHLVHLHSLILARAKSDAGQNETDAILSLESEILSVLLVAVQANENSSADNEVKRLAIDIFQLLISSWKTPSPEAELERYMWCCKAGATPSSEHRSRLLRTLSGLLSSSESTLTTPVALRTIIPALVFLLPRYIESTGVSSDYNFVKDILVRIIDGRCGHLDVTDIEQKYSASPHTQDTEDDMRQAICIEAILRCLEFGPDIMQKWVLRNVVEQYWPLPVKDDLYSPLMSKIHVNKMNVFLRSVTRLSNLMMNSKIKEPMDASIIYRMLCSRILPELRLIQKEYLNVTRTLLAKCILYLSTLDFPEQGDAVDLTVVWVYDISEWSSFVQENIKAIISTSDWQTTICIIQHLIKLPGEDSRRIVASWVIPELFNRIVIDSYSTNGALSALLKSLSELHPQIFFKPLFICAASNKEMVIVSQLKILMLVSRYVLDYWTRDPEMVSIALMSEVSGNNSEIKDNKDNQNPKWGKARLGQCAVLFELLYRIRELRSNQDTSTGVEAQTHSSLIKFVTSLEHRLGILLDAKERQWFVPKPQRALLSALFLEIRLFTHSLKPASWSSRLFDWIMQCHEQKTSFSDSVLVEDADIHDGLTKAYEHCKESTSILRKRASNLVTVGRGDDASAIFPQETGTPLIDLCNDRQKLLEMLPKEPMRVMLQLLVAMNGSLKQEDYIKLGPFLWENCLQSVDFKTIAATAFLIMQCAEKAPNAILHVIKSDLSSTLFQTKQDAIQRLSTLFSWRFQILSQTFINDRTHRRPFKLARLPIAFVPTDVGTNMFTRESGQGMHDLSGNILPSDLRRRLSEIGWTAEKQDSDQRTNWSMIPMALLSSQQFDKFAMHHFQGAVTPSPDISRSPSPNPSPSASPHSPHPDGGHLARDNSSSNIKRRPVIVQSLLPIFVDVAVRVTDQHFAIANSAKNLIMDFMREDPSTLNRPVMDILSTLDESFDTAVSTMRAFLHVQHVLPPSITHHLFNHLIGFLKYSARERNTPEVLRCFAYILPLVAKLADQINGISLRDIRRAKIEIFLFPSGSLWFPDNSPPGPMFPKGQNDVSSSEGPIWMSMIRLSQNLLFIAMLKRNPQDVLIIRKSMSAFVLPHDGGEIDAARVNFLSFLPHKPEFSHSTRGNSTDSIPEIFSAALARSHLLLTVQLFRCMSRHLSDRDDLRSHLNSVNLILVHHGNDIGVVALALLAYMVASIRFRRLMTSGSSFVIFLPTLFKVYCESKENIGIRLAIEYSIRRFYTIHEDTFVFQALDVIAFVMRQPDTDVEWIADNAYRFISALATSSVPTPDVAGIQEINRTFELETKLASTVEEQPQTLAGLRKDKLLNSEKQYIVSSVEFSDNKRFKMDNLVRMLLTVIAHEPTAQRAEQFLKLFRVFTKHLYEESNNIRNLLHDGLDALSVILLKLPHKNKVPEAAQIRTSTSGHSIEVYSLDNRGGAQLGTPSSPSDFLIMRQDYLLSLTAFVGNGGNVSISALQRAFEIIRMILSARDSFDASITIAANFCNSLGKSLAPLDDPKLFLSFLKEMSALINMYGSVLDLSATFNALLKLSSDFTFANNFTFCNVIVSQFCVSCLDICEDAASENLLLGLKFRYPFIALLCQSVTFLDSDIMEHICSRPSTPGYLGGILIPFSLSLKTSSQLSMDFKWKDSRRDHAHVRAWVKLLAYTLKFFEEIDMGAVHTVQRSNSINSLDRSKSDDKRISTSPISIAGVTIALQLLKVIIIRAEADLTKAYPGVWMRVALVIKNLTKDGNTLFAIPSALSFAASPALSSHLSPSSSQSNINRSGSISVNMQASLEAQPPRIVDYLLWSSLEILCLCHTPILIHLRLFMREKIHALDQRLRMLPAAERVSQQQRHSVFAKPRMSSMFSAPDNSPSLNPSASFPVSRSLSPFGIEYRSSSSLSVHSFQDAGNETPQASPSGLRNKIRHLGPNFKPSNTSRTPSLYGEGCVNIRSMLQTKRITEPELISQTYGRVRTVQIFLGYSTLLPMEGAVNNYISPWSQNDALKNIVVETNKLIHEFRDEFTTREPGFDLIHSSSAPLGSNE